MDQHSQFQLLRTRRFLPFFVTQFLGAFNDNIYKNCLMLLIAFSAPDALGLPTNLVMNLAAGLFILPFFLFSATAGQMADKYEKSAIMRKVKLAEVIIMSAAALAFATNSYWVLLILLFVMGAQSTFFGPAKYAILPQHVRDIELVGANALVEMGTFVAILVGTIGAALIVEQENARLIASAAIIVVAVLGYLSSRAIPAAPSANPELKVDYNPLRTTWKILKQAREQRGVYLAVMAISWFWFLGASYLTQFPNFAKTVLNGDASVVSLLLAMFTIGIAFGSMLCDRLSGHRIELGIVPLGSLGVTLFGIDFFFAVPSDHSVNLLVWRDFFTQPELTRLLIDLAGIGLFGGLFIVPLYAFIQQRTPIEQRARIIAANNILNALFMVASAVAGMILLGPLDLGIPGLFLVIAIMNMVVTLYVYSQVPEFALRFVIWMLSHTLYRVKSQGLDQIPEEGSAVLVCNHVSFVDALLIAGSVRRPIRFVMDHQIFKSPLLGWFFKLAKTIPIAPRHKDEAIYQRAFESISQELKAGNLICIFPEGKLTRDGEINEFRSGIETILGNDPVPVIPMALQGLWGSFFSHKGGAAFTKPPRRFWSRVRLLAGEPVPAENATASLLEQKVRLLRGDGA
ncbi:MAG: MFS transporter [Hahellaceae bacterium]|nr:MFS transporter [Hahellaceae bacterium]